MKVKFLPSNKEVEIKPGQSVMHLAEDNGIYIKSVCRGVPSCAECRVRVVEGEQNVFPPATAELGLIGSGWFIDRRRLSCQMQCIGDITVDLTEQEMKQKGLIGGRKAKLAKAVGDRIEVESVIRDERSERDGDGDANERGGEASRPRPRDDRQQQSGGGRPEPRAGSGGGGIVPRGGPISNDGNQSGEPQADGQNDGRNQGGGRRGRRGRRR